MAEEHEQLCKVLLRIVDCLPRIELYTETFLESSIIQDCVDAFFVSIIRFWARACKFYCRRRGQILKGVWNDFDAEFGELDFEMARQQERVESAALAEHIGESKVARTEQRQIGRKLIEAQVSSRQKEIISWLAPSAYDVHYYKQDLLSAAASRHSGTCCWVLNKEEFRGWSSPQEWQGSVLWIYAKPGAGKTILSSYLIDHYRSSDTSRARHGSVLLL